MEDITGGRSTNHKLYILNRKSCTLTGIIDVLSFDLHEVLLETDQGMLQIKGNDLHVKRVNLEKGELDMEGCVDSLQYTESHAFQKKGESLVSRLFR